MLKQSLLGLIALLTITCLNAQMTTPPSGANQKSYVKQYIGAIAHVSIMYNSPDVTAPNGESRKGKIWGQLIPYGMSPNNFGTASEIPWRAGANENTVIKFSHDMKVQGKDIKAGAYGLHIIPQESGPWTLIFSSNTTSWGSYYYSEDEDVLRVETTPEEAPYHEWLTYEFTDRQEKSATVALMWDELQIPFTIELPNAEELYVAKMKEDLRSSAGFTWQNWVSAANYCVANNTHLEDGLAWADAAISQPFIGQANFTTLSTKAGVLMAMNKADEAIGIMDKAIRHPTATSFQIHSFGRQLIAQGMKEKALEVFEYNFEKHEGAWPTHVGMARGLSANGQYKKALEHAQIAHEQAPDKLNKDGLAASIEKLKNGQDIN